jgi:hypothetical protein
VPNADGLTHGSSHPDKAPIANLNPTTQPRSTRNVDMIANDAIMLHDGARVNYYIFPDLSPTIDHRMRHNHCTLAKVCGLRNCSSRMNGTDNLPALRPQFFEQYYSQPVIANATDAHEGVAEALFLQVRKSVVIA